MNRADKIEDAKKSISMMQTYESVFSSMAGKLVFKDMQKSFGIYLFDPNPFVMARNVGAKEVLDRILAMIKSAKNRKLHEELLNPIGDEEEI